MKDNRNLHTWAPPGDGHLIGNRRLTYHQMITNTTLRKIEAYNEGLADAAENLMSPQDLAAVVVDLIQNNKSGRVKLRAIDAFMGIINRAQSRKWCETLAATMKDVTQSDVNVASLQAVAAAARRKSEELAAREVEVKVTSPDATSPPETVGTNEIGPNEKDTQSDHSHQSPPVQPPAPA